MSRSHLNEQLSTCTWPHFSLFTCLASVQPTVSPSCAAQRQLRKVARWEAAALDGELCKNYPVTKNCVCAGDEVLGTGTRIWADPIGRDQHFILPFISTVWGCVSVFMWQTQEAWEAMYAVPAGATTVEVLTCVHFHLNEFMGWCGLETLRSLLDVVGCAGLCSELASSVPVPTGWTVLTQYEAGEWELQGTLSQLISGLPANYQKRLLKQEEETRPAPSASLWIMMGMFPSFLMEHSAASSYSALLPCTEKVQFVLFFYPVFLEQAAMSWNPTAISCQCCLSSSAEHSTGAATLISWTGRSGSPAREELGRPGVVKA